MNSTTAARNLARKVIFSYKSRQFVMTAYGVVYHKGTQIVYRELPNFWRMANFAEQTGISAKDVPDIMGLERYFDIIKTQELEARGFFGLTFVLPMPEARGRSFQMSRFGTVLPNPITDTHEYFSYLSSVWTYKATASFRNVSIPLTTPLDDNVIRPESPFFGVADTMDKVVSLKDIFNMQYLNATQTALKCQTHVSFTFHGMRYTMTANGLVFIVDDDDGRYLLYAVKQGSIWKQIDKNGKYGSIKRRFIDAFNSVWSSCL